MNTNVQTISQLRQSAASRIEAEVESIATSLFKNRAVIKDAITTRQVYEVLNTVLWAETATSALSTAERIITAWFLGVHLAGKIIKDKSVDDATRRQTSALLIYAVDKLEEVFLLLGPTQVRVESLAGDPASLFAALVRHFDLDVRTARKLADDIVAEREATAETV